MNPDSENTPANTNDNLPAAQDGLPSSSVSPGGVIKPTGGAQAPDSPPQPPAEPQPPAPQQTESSPAPPSPAPVPPSQYQAPPANINPNPGSSPNPGLGGAASRQIFPEDTPGSSPTSKGVLNRKLLLFALPILLILLVAGVVFGYYIPNKPENVYKTGLDRSGDALEIILEKATEQETYDKFKKSEVTAAMDINYDNQNINGDFTAKFDESKLDTDLNLSFPSGESGQAELGFSVLSDKAQDKQFPDTYLNLRGVKAMGADLFLPGIGKYDGKWLAISSDYIQSIADEYGIEAKEQDNTENYPTFDDISSFVREVYGDTNEYVFTSDPEKAVLENRQYLGKEDVDGVSTYHYEVGLNKENYKAYCEAVSNTLLSSPVYKKLSGADDETVESEKQKIGENCRHSSEDIKDDETFEMWVDSKYKLIKKIRIYSGEEKTDYFEMGQNYDGSDKLSLFFGFHSDNGPFDIKSTLTTDLNIGESSGEITFNGGSGETGAYDGKITMSMKPLSGDFEITKPGKTINIEKLLKEFGVDPKGLASFYGGNPAGDFASGVNDKGQDATVKSDVLAVHSHLEVYFAENAYYPTKLQLNDQSWRASNMLGLNDDAFSSVEYNPFDCNFDECQKYTLSGKLSGGNTFTRTGSNN